MAQYCDHGGYTEHRIGDGECGLCEDLAGLRAQLAAALACVESARLMREHLTGSESGFAAQDEFDANERALRELTGK